VTEAPAAKPLRQTPLHDLHVALGARMVPFAGYEMPVQYTSIIEEHRTVRSAVGLFDLSHMGEIDVRGRRAVEFLGRAIVSDPSTLTDGQAQYSMLCQEDGGIIDDLIVYRLGEERFMVVCNAANRDAVVAHLAGLHAHDGQDVELDDRSDVVGLVAPQGPAAASVLSGLTDVDLDALENYHAATGSVAGTPAIVARTGYTGEDGFELFCDAGRIREVWEAVATAGGAAGLRPSGLGARDTLRLEAGMNLYGSDMDETVTPLESGLAWTVALEGKRDFIGRAALEKQLADGVARQLTGLLLEDRGVLRAHQKVFAGAAGEGEVTSGTFSPTLERSIALARLPAASAGRVEVDIRGKRVPARIVKPPFARNGKARIEL
jgi:aminomethyltransferase